MRQATFDPARDLTLYFRCNRAGSKDFVFVRSNGSAYSFIYTDDLELNIYKNQGDKKKLISLTYISGLSLNVNTLTATITSSISNINEGEYYWELFRTDLEKTWLCGDAIFHNGKFDGVLNDSETITVTEDGEDILITIQDNNPLISRVQSVTSAATVTPNADEDDAVKITAQATALLLANPSGTPTEMQGIVIRIKDNGTARAITYGNQYREIGTTLPTTTVISKTIYLAIVWNATDSKWDVIGVREEV